MFCVLNQLGLLTNLMHCLDAGDERSYNPAAGPERWWDLSGQGNHYWRGASAAVEGSDPTFVGTAGKRWNSEYFSFDGGDKFTSQLAGAGAWFQSLHKDNAKFTLANWVYKAAAGLPGRMFSTAGGNNTDTGIEFALFGSNIELGVRKGSGGASYVAQQAVTLTNDAWHFFAVSVDEAAATGIFQVNLNQYNFAPTYVTPSAGNSTSVPILYSDYNASLPAANGTRSGNSFAWSPRALTAQQLMALFYATRGKWSI